MKQIAEVIDRRAVRVALAKADMKQWQLAAKLGISPSMLADVLSQRRAASATLTTKLAAFLKKVETTQ
jgi:ribosome-binding protein aMBF1 (putative translation factor)